MRSTVLVAIALIAPALLAAQAERPIGVFYIEEAARLTHRVDAECTPDAIAAQASELVEVRIQINESGEPASLKVVDSPRYGLGPKALQAISQWRWQVAPNGSEERRIDAGIQIPFACGTAD